MSDSLGGGVICDHCRIGSLENICQSFIGESFDHCRIGSLETANVVKPAARIDHCRIGSLEIVE